MNMIIKAVEHNDIQLEQKLIVSYISFIKTNIKCTYLMISSSQRECNTS